MCIHFLAPLYIYIKQFRIHNIKMTIQAAFIRHSSTVADRYKFDMQHVVIISINHNQQTLCKQIY